MTKAYTLIELLITLAIAAILAGFSYKLYEWHLVSVRRADGQLALVKLSAAMENYYLQHNSYRGAAFSNIDYPDHSPQGFYHLSFALEQDGQMYTLKATPVGDQAKKDQACGALLLTTDGRRSYEGDDSKASCW
ncbi:MAG: pilE 1 [Gammaproteobacteria bacterium]|jgi:type IV pilus assembly protein PilE|nr:pilE 1 [Gammaproteobacteria bacterium]